MDYFLRNKRLFSPFVQINPSRFIFQPNILQVSGPTAQGPNNPAIVEAPIGNLFPWTNINNILTSNDTYASVTSDSSSNDVSDTLYAQNFGFSIPQTATINGIEYTIEAYASNNNLMYTSSSQTDLQLVLISQNLATQNYGRIEPNGPDIAYTTNEQIYTVGGPTYNWDLWGDNGLITPSIINDVGFGLTTLIRFPGNTPNLSLYVDNIRLKVYYTNNPTADLIPNALNWTNAVGGLTAITNTQTISGIDIPITLKLEWSITSGLEPNITMDVNGTPRTISQNVGTETFPLQSVQNGHQITFSFISVDSQGTFTVKNASDNDTVLDTFTWFLLD